MLPHPPGSVWKGIAFHDHHCQGVGDSSAPLPALEAGQMRKGDVSSPPFADPGDDEQNVHSFSSHSETDTPKQGELQSSPNGSFGNYLTILRHLTRKNYGTARDKLCAILSLRFQRS